MKELWKNGKLTSLGRRMLLLMLSFCLIVSLVQGAALKDIFAEENISGSDSVSVSSSDKEAAEAVLLSGTDGEAASDTDKGTNSNAYGGPKVTMTTAKAVGSSFTLSVGADDDVYVDWGDGNIVPYTKDGITKGTVIKIYCDSDIDLLYCYENQLTALDVSGNPLLRELSCYGNQLTTLDLSNSTGLVLFSCSNNDFTALDVSSCTKLEQLACSHCSLSELDVSKNAELNMLECQDNKLTELDVSSNTKLRILSCASNLLTELDLSGNSELKELFCSVNSIEKLTLGSSAMSMIDCEHNELRFSSMPADVDAAASYDYAPQAEIAIPSSVEAGKEIDLSSEYDINGTKTVYTWYDLTDDSEVTPTDAENGVFTFGDDFVGKLLYCKLSNDAFPELTLQTTLTEIAERDYGELKITMTTAKEVGSTLDLTVTADDTVYIDWGDGNIVPYAEDGVTAGSEIKFYCKGKITYFSCGKVIGSESNEITALDVSRVAELKSLSCNGNQLTKLDVSKNTELAYLYCYSNELAELDVSNNIKLIELRCESNKLSSLDVSKNADLVYLWCTNNELNALDISNNLMLIECWCNYNNLRFSTMSKNINYKFHPVTVMLKFWAYRPQSEVVIPEKVKAGTEIDLSSEYYVYDTYTVYTWYDSEGNTVTPTTSENGVFTFGEEYIGEKLYCTMDNKIFELLTLKTTVVEIIGETEETESDTDITPDETESDSDITPDKPESDSDIIPDVMGDSDSADPDTGDHSNNALVIAIMANSFVLIAAYGINGAVVVRKKRKAENKQ